MSTEKHRMTIGLLIGWKVEPELLMANALVAASYGADFFYFYPAGVDEDRRCIRGWRLEHDDWTEAEFAYPDVIYDRMRRRGIRKYDEVYRKLERIPFTHTLRGMSVHKTVAYNMLRKDDELKRYLIPFQTLRDATQGLAFIYKHGQVICKPDKGTSGKGAFTIRVAGNEFEVFDQQLVHRMNETQLLAFLQLLIEEKYCLQKLVMSVTRQGLPFHIRVHIAKNGHNEWIIAFCAVWMSAEPHVVVTNSKHTFQLTTTWDRFVKYQFDEDVGGATEQRIHAYALQLATYMEQQLDGRLHEIALDIGIDEDGHIRLFEVGAGVPSAMFQFVEMARPAIAYSLYVAEHPELA
ncbi:YheC/YheD family protein [Paenibacillus campi]|uniref:YheC/YheD family protein n=1 Tax=Paenibacillus campi TaxID=3106031 RepID=UPI002AFFBB89|nr:YheC/YheD family protein [Paenibacillus sp. SGZ-1014]